LIILGSGAPDVHVYLATGGGQGPTPAVVEVERSALEKLGENNTAVEAVGRSGAAPESVGTKREAPEQGSSGRPTKKPRVCSKM
jgi:hypothetical protein